MPAAPDSWSTPTRRSISTDHRVRRAPSPPLPGDSAVSAQVARVSPASRRTEAGTPGGVADALAFAVVQRHLNELRHQVVEIIVGGQGGDFGLQVDSFLRQFQRGEAVGVIDGAVDDG